MVQGRGWSVGRRTLGGNREERWRVRIGDAGQLEVGLVELEVEVRADLKGEARATLPDLVLEPGAPGPGQGRGGEVAGTPVLAELLARSVGW